VQNFPHYRALTYEYADLLLNNREAKDAVKLLDDQINSHPMDTRLYDLEARAYHQLSEPLEEHRAEAYSYAWQGNLPAAMMQLQIAKRSGGSFYQLSIIESDIRDLGAMLADQEKGKKRK
jgi:predicted Zn-dependent protease